MGAQTASWSYGFDRNLNQRARNSRFLCAHEKNANHTKKSVPYRDCRQLFISNRVVPYCNEFANANQTQSDRDGDSAVLSALRLLFQIQRSKHHAAELG